VSWGKQLFGGDSTDVKHQLLNVQKLQASQGAFCPSVDRRKQAALVCAFDV